MGVYLNPDKIRQRGFSAGPFKVRPLGERQKVTSVRDTERETTFGWCYLWEARAPGGVYLKLGLTDLATRHRDVRPLYARGGNEAFARLNCGGLRLPLNPVPDGDHDHSGRYYVVLRQAQILPGLEQWSRLFDAPRRSLSHYAGGPIGEVLGALGARDVDTRENAYDEDNSRRRLLCAVFDEHDVRVPIAAFLLTRAVPLLQGKMRREKR